MNIQKRIAAVHDISGFGKCSLTVALPVISSAGFEVSVIPTAVLSTHTAVKPGYTCRDLTEDMLPFAKHWKSIGLCFDAIYTGYLGSTEQVDIVCEIIDMFKREETLIVVDPAMADNGKMYALFDRSFADEMKKLCKKADVIVPNVTEALFLLGEDYKEGPYTKEFVLNIIERLHLLGPKKIVLTGVSFDNRHIGAVCHDAETDSLNIILNKKIEGTFHGTGDVFASALTAALLKGKSLKKATKTAVDFTVDSIKRTANNLTSHQYGVDFERSIPRLIKKLK